MNPHAASRLYRNRSLLLLLLMATSIALSWPSIRTLAELARNHEQYSHILLILPISMGFALAESDGKTTEAKASLGWGLALFLPAAILGWIGAGHGVLLSESVRLSLAILALVLLWLSFVLLIYGPTVFIRFRFPLLTLLLLVPIPDLILSKIILGLQAASAKTAYALFRLAGIPVTQSGFVLSLPSLEIEVAQECSGIRSSMMLLVTTLVLGHLYLKEGWQKLVLILLIIPVAVFKNALRIFVLATLAVYVDESWLNGRLHHHGGIVFFMMGIALVGLIIWALRYFEFGRYPKECPAPEVGYR